MQSISIFSKIIRFFVAFVVAVFLSCFESHADDCVLGTDGCAPEFTVTTTELSAGTTFSFEISAAGTYYIDWGDGGAIETIVKNSVGEQTITHTYTNAGQYTIGMAGQATLYSTDNTTAAISFKENTNISGISGSLGAIFGTLTDRVNSYGTLMSDAQPRFYRTFFGCSNLSGNIPENLFAGISGAPARSMFYSTFDGCSGLSGSIPENLFAGISGAPADAMFRYTFSDCSGLSGSIPENLFAGISGAPASYMFSGTFSGCSNLSGNIPANLFAGIKGAPVDGMFMSTFSGCSGLSGSIPENLFAGISGAPASYMFGGTFVSCRGLSGSIPENLFAGISGAPADFMFNGTFNSCSGLSGSIPENLFVGIKGAPADDMFRSTFSSCSGLSGSIPENLFVGIKGAPASNMFRDTFNSCSGLSGYVPANLFTGIDKTTTASYQMKDVFNGTGLETSCPASMYQYLTGFESDFQGKVACEVCPANFPDSDLGDNVTIDKCYTACPEKVDVTLVSGHKYYTVDGIGNTETCKYQSEIQEPEFIITTTDLSAGTMFSFTISVAGTYYIDWGDGGEIEPIVKGTVGAQTITHTYTNAGQYTIGMSGQATLYSTSTTAAISFKENTNISGISGSLGAIFGTLTDRVNSDGTLMSDAQPRFYYTFAGCSNLSGNIPENLFAGISGAPADYMFSGTFYHCSGLSGSIPENLFAGISGAPASYMFYSTFSSCSGLSGSIPENLFAGIKGKPAAGMFDATFYNCSGLSGSIPENLFAGINGAPASDMFRGTFFGCSGLSGYVPANLFAGIDKTTTALNMMYLVFYNTGLATSCPADTYKYLTGFESNFNGKVACSACPADYPNSDTGATSENECYRKCTTDDVAGAHSVTGNNYYGTGVDTCQEAVYYISAGEYLPAGDEEPADCPSGYYCPGAGDVKYDEEKDQGLVLCPTDFPNSDSGAKTESDCYKPCTTDDVAGAMTVVGRNYYGDGTDTCDATECVAGWNVKPGETLADIIGGYSNVNSAIIGWNSQYTGSFNEWNRDNLGAKGEEYYGITENNTFAWDYGDLGMVYGRALCSSKYATTFDELTDETGGSNAIHCYCRFDGYKPVGENKQNVTASWVYIGTYGSSCSDNCIFYCGNNGSYSAMLNTEQITFGTCTEIIYTLNPGQYLPAGGEDPVDCPSGYYCPGAGDVKYDEEKDQGLVACPDGYDNSDSGAKTESDCYKPCTTDDVAGSMTVVGRNYYGDGTDTCDATECVAGWRLKSGKTLADVIGTESGINSASVNSMGTFIEDDGNGSTGQAYYDISKPGEFAVGYGDRGIITGWALCSTKGGTGVFNGGTSADKITRFDELVDESDNVNADYCYCMIDDYTPYGGVKQSVSTPWFLSAYESSCQAYCEKSCSMALRRTAVLMEAVLGAAELSGDMCEENGTYLPDGATEYVRCPDGYDNSDIGATSENQCYKQCTTDDVAGAMTVVGTDYYGDGLNTCAATQCLADWILQDLSGHIGNVNGVDSAFISTDSTSYGEFYEDDLGDNGLKGLDYYGISEPGEFAVDYGENGIITGRALCSTKPGTNNNYTWTNPTVFDELTDETGQSGADYCYCQVDSFISTSGLVQILSGMPWVYYDSCSGNGVSKCERSCAARLRQNSSSYLAFRSAIFGYSTCEEGMYRMNAGIYLPAGASDAVICPSGSYCPGADNVKLNEDKDQGLVACPVDYPNSDTGAKSENDCYKQCTTDDVANSMTVTGKNYYGDRYDTCAATQCLADWKLQDLYGIVGDTEGLNSAYISTNSSSYGEFVEYNEPRGQDYYAISEPGAFGIDYGDMGVITGRARCSTKPGTNNDYAWTDPTMFAELPDESSVDGARYCYCQVDSYTPVGGLTQVLSDMPWVFRGEERSKDNCNNSCANNCMYQLMENYTEALAFRSAVFGYASCDEEVYRVNPGDYLPEGADAPSDCPPGSYCPGAEDISSRPSKAQGVNECPAEYPYSDSGAKSENDCYRDCTSDDVVNSMTVAGRNYYGDGVDTCEPTDCVAGWHLKLGLNLEDLIGSTYEGSNSSYMAGTNSAYIDNNGSFVEYNTADNGAAKGQEYYGITSNNSFAVGYGDSGMIRGHSICSTQSDDIVDDLTDESDNTDATNCYCRIEEYISADGVKQNVAASWVKWGDISWYPGACESNCVQNCASNMREHMTLDFRGKMFEASMEIPMCLANKININWNLGYGDNNSSTTTCSYNEVIVLPQEPVRPGYIFTGWKVLKSNQ